MSEQSQPKIIIQVGDKILLTLLGKSCIYSKNNDMKK